MCLENKEIRIKVQEKDMAVFPTPQENGPVNSSFCKNNLFCVDFLPVQMCKYYIFLFIQFSALFFM